jgi:hypothetical protein
MLTLKYEGISNWLIFLKKYLLDISYCFYALDVGIAFGKQDVLT